MDRRLFVTGLLGAAGIATVLPRQALAAVPMGPTPRPDSVLPNLSAPANEPIEPGDLEELDEQDELGELDEGVQLANHRRRRRRLRRWRRRCRWRKINGNWRRRCRREPYWVWFWFWV